MHHAIFKRIAIGVLSTTMTLQASHAAPDTQSPILDLNLVRALFAVKGNGDELVARINQVFKQFGIVTQFGEPYSVTSDTFVPYLASYRSAPGTADGHQLPYANVNISVDKSAFLELELNHLRIACLTRDELGRSYGKFDPVGPPDAFKVQQFRKREDFGQIDIYAFGSSSPQAGPACVRMIRVFKRS